jgi:regulator of cell morphogenesis and NO signaling
MTLSRSLRWLALSSLAALVVWIVARPGPAPGPASPGPSDDGGAVAAAVDPGGAAATPALAAAEGPPSPETTVAELARRFPAATRVFVRHDIDFCCGGERPLREACAKAGVAPEVVLDAIAKEVVTSEDRRWDQEPPAALVEHLVSRYHQPLAEELPRLSRLAVKVREVHRAKDPQRLEALAAAVAALQADLEVHAREQERTLFAPLVAGRHAEAAAAIEALASGLTAVATGVERLRVLTDHFTAPPEACNAWRALYQGLADLDAKLQRHLHLEKHLLYPRAAPT